MPQLDDERIALLQRIAYGQGTSDVERVSAAAELGALREGVPPEAIFHRPGAVAPAVPVPVPVTVPALQRSVGGPFATRLADAPDRPAAVPSPRKPSTPSFTGSVLRWTLAAAVIALTVGVVTGWSFGARGSGPGIDPAAAPADIAEVALPLGGVIPAPVPVAEARAVAVFDREQTPADLPAVPGAVPAIDATSYRLLLTRPDGVSVHAARSIDGRDVCLAIVRPGGGMGSTCTIGGLFPGDGLWIEVGDGSDADRATWDASGVVAVGVAG